jgi:hypothetical protein
MNVDLINGIFELGSGLLQIINVVKLYKDKELKGISVYPMMFFTLWGFWNLYYYPILGQTMSFIGGLFIVATNVTWLYLVFYYWKKGWDKEPQFKVISVTGPYGIKLFALKEKGLLGYINVVKRAGDSVEGFPHNELIVFGTHDEAVKYAFEHREVSSNPIVKSHSSLI